MSRSRLVAACWLAVAGAGLASCAGLSGLDAPSEPLGETERAAVQEQADRSVSEGRYKSAWNQEVAAGADRARLERIAVQALLDRSRHAQDMFAALRTRWGALGSASRARIAGAVAEAQREDAWLRALDFELLSADDPPTFSRAWAVYRAAPPERAGDLLDAIRDAREEHTEPDD